MSAVETLQQMILRQANKHRRNVVHASAADRAMANLGARCGESRKGNGGGVVVDAIVADVAAAMVMVMIADGTATARRFELKIVTRSQVSHTLGDVGNEVAFCKHRSVEKAVAAQKDNVVLVEINEIDFWSARDGILVWVLVRLEGLVAERAGDANDAVDARRRAASNVVVRSDETASGCSVTSFRAAQRARSCEWVSALFDSLLLFRSVGLLIDGFEDDVPTSEDHAATITQVANHGSGDYRAEILVLDCGVGQHGGSTGKR